MKKIITLLALVSCLIISIPASAQVRLGIKVGTNLPKNTFEDLNYEGLTQSLSVKNSTGFFVGPTLDVKIPVLGLGFDAGLNYSLRRVTMEYENMVGKIHESKTNNQHMLEIPLNLKYTFSVGDVLGIYAAVGPAFSFNLNKNSFWDDMHDIAGEIWENGTKYVRNSAEVSINAGVGVLILNHLQVGVNYNWALTDDAKASGEDFVNAAWKGSAVKNRMWQVSLAYMF